MDALTLKLTDGVSLAVPASLQSVTTFVLLEQERWFEKEADFLRRWLQPGMTVIDIGANLGVYSLLMARAVAPTGRVFAYEPGSGARTLLERSRDLNGAANLHISPLALSDGEREGWLVFGESSELNALGTGGAGEAVRIASLDSEDAARDWGEPDFIKIDAEGEVERILAGGRGFLARHSPLVMFEIKESEGTNERLRSRFPELGYRLFRQLAGAAILVPQEPHEPVDAGELNLFAAKPDRASRLAEQGCLVDTIAPFSPSPQDREKAQSFWRSQRFASQVVGAGVTPDSGYLDSLAAYAIWRSADRPAATRCAALAFALRGLRAICQRAPTPVRLSTLARVASEWGARAESVAVLQHLLQAIQKAPLQFGEPFWPASARFDNLAPGAQPANWFATAAAEQFEQSNGFSCVFTGGTPVLPWLCAQPLASVEMERRRILVAVRTGQRPKVPARLCSATPEHLNAEIWRSGQVPGTVL